MIIKYVTGGYGKYIERVEIQRETDASVWINGSRNGKWTDWKKYHDTWDHAKNYLIETKTAKVRNYQSQLDSAKDELSKIKKLEKL